MHGNLAMDRRHAALIPGARDLPRAGDRLLDRAEEARGLQPRQRDRDAAGGGRDRPARHRGARPDQVDVLPAVPVRGRLRRRTAVLPRPRQGRPEADRVLADRAGAVPAGAVRLREDRRPRRRLRGRPVRGLADDLGVDRRRHRPDQLGSACPPSRRRPTPTRFRSATPSRTSSARSARRSCWRRSARS